MNNIEEYIWKGKKELSEDGQYYQEEKRMVDMTEKELKDAYDRCKIMLFNQDPKNPGRYAVLAEIYDQRDRCGAELFLRFMEQKMDTGRISLLNAINEFRNNNKEALAQFSRVDIDIVFKNLPDRFKGIPLDLIIDGCLDRLGVFNKRRLTRAFILRQGIWLTPEESRDLVEKDRFGNIIDKMQVIRERLNIKSVERLFINDKGFNYTELRSMLMLKPNKKYRDLTTVQLETLRNKVLFLLEENVQNHISFWEGKMKEIEEVTNYKNINL